LIGASLTAFAADEATPGKERRAGPRGHAREKILQKYDANKNGVLDPEEREAAKKDRQQLKTKALEKFDKDGDGKLNEEERAAAREELKKRRQGKKD
jgi:hypothetical protein